MSKREFVIPFIGLKIGNHLFEYDINDDFFQGIEYSIIHSGKVHVTLNLDKRENMMVGIFHVDGKVFTNCDRCNDPIEVEAEGEYQIVYKFGEEVSEDEALIVLEPNAFELDVKDYIYELISVSIPVRSVHEKDKCDPEMIALYEKYVVNASEEESEEGDDDDDDDDTDEIWAMLKNLN
jgi:uncharacterized metal-binding protein YceD (DUF177 family)